MSLGREPLIIGHRGASGYRPEHTSGAYRLAFRVGADAVEPDIVATRDGVLVLRHENELSSTTDIAQHAEFAARRTTKAIDGHQVSGWFTEDFTWAELSTLRARERLTELRSTSATFDGFYPLMRLADLFALVDDESERSSVRLTMVAEIKHATYFESIGLPLHELLMAEIVAAGWQDRHDLVVESFERTVLTRLGERGFTGERVYLMESGGVPADRLALDGSTAQGYDAELTLTGLYSLSARGDPIAGLDGISVDTGLVLRSGSVAVELFAEDTFDAEIGTVTSDLVDLAHSVGLRTYCWTLRPENVFLPELYRNAGRDDQWGNWRQLYTILLRSGVDGVFADHPDLAVDMREAT